MSDRVGQPMSSSWAETHAGLGDLSAREFVRFDQLCRSWQVGLAHDGYARERAVRQVELTRVTVKPLVLRTLDVANPPLRAQLEWVLATTS